MSKIDDSLIKKIAPAVSAELRAEYVKYFNAYCTRFNINTQLRLSAFFANIMVESGRLTRTQENLNYSAQRLMEVWHKRFPTFEIASRYAHKPRELANYVYNGRNGNHPNTDDGWQFRGGGFGQETGRGNYRSLGQLIKIDLEENPDYLRTPQGAIESACAGWASRGCNQLADKRAITATRERINGGANGLAECKTFYSMVLGWIPDNFDLSPTALDQIEVSTLSQEVLPIDNDHVPDTTNTADQGSPAWIDQDDSEASDSSSLTGQPVTDSNVPTGLDTQAIDTPASKPPPSPQVVKKETPATFIKWITGLKLFFGALLTGVTTWCSSNDIANTVASKAANRAVDNVDQSFAVHLGVILLYTLIGVGAGIFLMYIASKFYDRASQRAAAITQAKVAIASDDSKATVELTNDRARTTAIQQAKT